MFFHKEEKYVWKEDMEKNAMMQFVFELENVCTFKCHV